MGAALRFGRRRRRPLPPVEFHAGSGYARLALILIAVVLLLLGILAAVGIQSQSLFSGPATTIEPPTTTEPTTEPGYDELATNLESLRQANVAFNAPTTLQRHESAVIQLLLSLEKPISDLQSELQEAGEQEGARVKVSPLMEARLTGPGFKIEAITEETLAVIPGETTEWKWDVEAVETGNQRLHLTLTAFLLKVNDQQARHTIRTFDKTVAIEVTLANQITGFFGRMSRSS